VSPNEGLLLVAHGSRDPRAAVVAQEVAAAVGLRVPDLAAEAAFLELAEPDPPSALDELALRQVRTVTVLPFLLSHAYHSKIDLPGVAAAARTRGLRVRTGAVLGPHGLLLDAVERRLVDTDTAYDALVLAAAGSTDPDANASVEGVAAALSERLRVPVVAGYASAAKPTVSEAVRQSYASGAKLVAVATYLLAPGFFADSVRDSALSAGAVAVSEPLGPAPEIVQLVIERLREASTA
jgi:sirohydrochlorin ferrochelatase